MLDSILSHLHELRGLIQYSLFSMLMRVDSVLTDLHELRGLSQFSLISMYSGVPIQYSLISMYSGLRPAKGSKKWSVS